MADTKLESNPGPEEIIWTAPDLSLLQKTSIAIDPENHPATQVQETSKKSNRATKHSDLMMPEVAMYGWLGDQARTLGAPLGWSYCSLVAIYAGLHSLRIAHSGAAIRPTVDVALLGDKGVGKSKTIQNAMARMNPKRVGLETATISSDRGLLQAFSQIEGEKTANLLCLDELRSLMAKIGIQGSGVSLASALCELFYNDSAAVQDKKGEARVWTRLSILGCLKAKDASEFRTAFGAETTGGLYDRFIFVPGPRRWDWDHELEIHSVSRQPVRVGKSSEAHAAVREWIKAGWAEGKDRGRLGEVALRVACISASANAEDRISPACIQAALHFAEWQELVRKTYAAGTAETKDAQAMQDYLEGIMSRYVKPDGEVVSFRHRDYIRGKSWYSKYGSMLTRIKQALIQDGVLIEEKEWQGEAENRRLTPTGWLHLDPDYAKDELGIRRS